MRSRFDEQLIELNTEMIEMGNQIIRAINEAIEALIKRDVEKAIHPLLWHLLAGRIVHLLR